MLKGMERAAARRRIGPDGLRALDPAAGAAGTDRLPKIRHIVVLMMENHSYDNYLGMLARGGAGFTLGADGMPAETNPNAAGAEVPLWYSPRTVQWHHVPPRPGTPATSSGTGERATASSA